MKLAEDRRLLEMFPPKKVPADSVTDRILLMSGASKTRT